ncbi:MAG TPA: DUF1801 domain-containing protein [Sphingomicrobium sp.]
MARSDAPTPDAYLAELPADRAGELASVRDAVIAAMPDGYVERMAWGMISWEVPLERSGKTYNGQPLVYAALAAQKNHNALYLNCVYASEDRAERFRERFAASGKKLDMGKSCIRFKRAADLDLDAIAEAVGDVTPDDYIAMTNAAHEGRRKR